MRSRGLKGREEASERSIVFGNGSQGGITDVGRSVLLSGLPGKISTNAVRQYLKDYSLIGGRAEVVKLDMCVSSSSFDVLSCPFTPVPSPSHLHRISRSTLTSRVLVRLRSASEAFRLLRNLHMTNYEPDVWEDRYIIRANLVR
jgi:hypothetical protein